MTFPRVPNSVPRILTIVVVGVLGLILLGKWDGAISASDRAHAEVVRAHLGSLRSFNVRQAEWREAQAEWESRAQTALADADSLRAARIRREAAETPPTPIAAVLSESDGVSVNPEWHGDTAQIGFVPAVGWSRTGWMVLDSNGVGWLRQLHADKAKGDTLLIDSKLEGLRLRESNDALDRAILLAGMRADTTDAILATSTELLGETLKRMECTIVLGIRCPSRTTSFIVGTVLGAVAVYGLVATTP